MFCYKCGKEVEEGTKFCPYCGAQLDMQPSSEGYYEPIHDQMNNQQTPVREDDAPSGGFAFLSFLVPIVGLVLYLIWNKEYPLKAKSCLKGFIANIVLTVVMFCCVMAATAGIASQYEDEFDFYDSQFDTVVEIVPYE